MPNIIVSAVLAVATTAQCALGTEGVRLGAPDVARNFSSGWHVTVSIAGGRRRSVQIDTGSIGFVVGRSAIGKHAIGPLAPGRQEYTSDGLILLGHFFRASVVLEGTSGRAVTAPVKILGVESFACDPKYPTCSTRGRNPDSVGVMGVGFDRKEHVGSNLFLSIADMSAHRMHPGYIIAADSITLGLTQANTKGFRYTSLVRANGDWKTAPGCFGFVGRPGFENICGTILVDTGLPSMILSRARPLRPPGMQDSIPRGTRLTFGIPDLTNGAMNYSADAGAIRWSNATGSDAFANTGRAPLRRYDYLYDSGCGRVGFRPRR